MTNNYDKPYCHNCEIETSESEPLIEHNDGRFLCYFCYDKEAEEEQKEIEA